MKKAKKTSPALIRWSDLGRLFGTAAVMFFALAAAYFPWSTDNWRPGQEEMLSFGAAEDFYEEVYSGESQEADADAADDHGYVLNGQATAQEAGVAEIVAEFAADYELESAHVLEVGAGSGQLQDVVDDYTGLDIAASAKRYFHKPFVAGSATNLPFDDSSFDSVLSIWTLEHVPNPERALNEIRRVTKDGGYLFLWPAWVCPPWLAEGYTVRPYSDFDLAGKFVKASLIVRQQPMAILWGTAAGRVLRNAYWRVTGQQTRLRFWRLEANYDHYWAPDADAAVSLDIHEMMLWFLSRGDECMGCPTNFFGQVQMLFEPLIIRVKKNDESLVARR